MISQLAIGGAQATLRLARGKGRPGQPDRPVAIGWESAKALDVDIFASWKPGVEE